MKQAQTAAKVAFVPGILGGEHEVVAGTRVPARTIIAYIKDGYSDSEIFEDYPSLPPDGIDAVRAWASANQIDVSAGIRDRDLEAKTRNERNARIKTRAFGQRHAAE